MIKIENAFVELLQVALGNRDSFSVSPNDEEWEKLYDMAKKQTLVGICFFAVKRLPQEQLPPQKRLRQWAVKAMKIEEKNKRITGECKAVTELFDRGNYGTCVLKGQSNTLIYPKGMASLRTPGDIDLWVWEKTNRESYGGSDIKTLNKKRLVRAIWRLSRKKLDVAVHHAECEILKQTPVEVHFEPSFSMNLFTDYRMQRYWRTYPNATVKTEKGFNMPTTAFNIVFQMSHVFRHLLLEGIGFRQLIDFYFLLVRFHEEKGSRDKVMKDISMLSMKKITAAVMWIMKMVFLMDEKYLLCSPSEKYGKEMLHEILEGGNFGHHFEDKAERKLDNEGKETTSSKLESNWETVRRGMKFLSSYPSECLWTPVLCIRASIVRNYWRRVRG